MGTERQRPITLTMKTMEVRPVFVETSPQFLRWLNTGTAVKTQTVYTTEGMPEKLCDANDLACANPTICTYDFTGVFPSSVQQPTTGSIQHIDHVTYDKNTGKLTSHIDPNGVTTSYLYNDPLGRLSLVESAVGSLNWSTGLSAQSDTAYKYRSATEVDIEQDLTMTNDAALVSKTIYDGLGRPFQAIARTARWWRQAMMAWGGYARFRIRPWPLTPQPA